MLFLYLILFIMALFNSATINAMQWGLMRDLLKEKNKEQLKKSEEDQSNKVSPQQCHLASVPNDVAKEIVKFCLVNDMPERYRKKRENYYVEGKRIYKREPRKLGFLNQDKLLFEGPNSTSKGISPSIYNDFFDIKDFAVNKDIIAVYAVSQFLFDCAHLLIIGRVGQSMQTKNDLEVIEVGNDQDKSLDQFKLLGLAPSKDGQAIVSLEAMRYIAKSTDARLVYRKKNQKEWQKIRDDVYPDFELVRSMKLHEDHNELILFKRKLIELKQNNYSAEFVKLPQEMQFPEPSSHMNSYLRNSIVTRSLEKSK